MFDYVLFEKYTKELKILFVEDDKEISMQMEELLSDIFPKVDIAFDGKEGLEKYISYFKENKKTYDLVITDIKMPFMDGIELTKKIYDIESQQNIIVLSAHNEADYLLQLVNIGIDQFITKPIDYDNFMHIMFLVCKNIYQKSLPEGEKDNKFIQLSDSLLWDKDLKQLIKDEELVKLTKKEILLISLLLEVPEKTYTTEEIISRLWKDDIYSNPDISNLKNIISRLRKKIHELNIENIYGFGYKITISL